MGRIVEKVREERCDAAVALSFHSGQQLVTCISHDLAKLRDVHTAVQVLTLAEAAAFLPASRSGSLPRAAALRSSATSALAKSFARCPESALIAPLALSAFCSAS